MATATGKMVPRAKALEFAKKLGFPQKSVLIKAGNSSCCLDDCNSEQQFMAFVAQIPKAYTSIYVGVAAEATK